MSFGGDDIFVPGAVAPLLDLLGRLTRAWWPAARVETDGQPSVPLALPLFSQGPLYIYRCPRAEKAWAEEGYTSTRGGDLLVVHPVRVSAPEGLALTYAHGGPAQALANAVHDAARVQPYFF